MHEFLVLKRSPQQPFTRRATNRGTTNWKQTLSPMTCHQLHKTVISQMFDLTNNCRDWRMSSIVISSLNFDYISVFSLKSFAFLLKPDIELMF